MLTYQMGIAQAESRMMVAQGYQVAIVLEDLRILLQVCPVQAVDAIGRLEGVMDALLVAQQFLTTEHEGDTLRRKDSRLGQQVKANQLFRLFLAQGTLAILKRGDTGLQTVDETHIVVTRDIGQHLRGFTGPGCLAVVHLRHIHLRMADAAHDAELHALLTIRRSAEPARLGIVAERSAQRIAQLIGKGRYARHLTDVGLHAKLAVGQCTGSCAPPLAIDDDRRVQLVQLGTDGIHRLQVVTAHQVEAEAVDTVFIIPMLHRLNHEPPHHGLFRGRLIAAARAVGVSRLAISPWRVTPVVIVRIGTLEVAVLDVVGVVVDHVEDDGDASLMERLHHLFELTYAAHGVIGIGGVAAIRHVIVHGVIAPVILQLVQPRLIDRAEIVAGQDMNGIDTQRLQVCNSPWFGEGQKLSRISGIRTRNGKVAMMEFVNDQVGRRLDDRMLVAAPVLWECLEHVDDGATAAIDTYGLGENAGAFSPSHIEGIEGIQEIALYVSTPQAVAILHANCLLGLTALPVLVNTHHNLLGISRSKKAEGGLFGRIRHFIEVKLLGFSRGKHGQRQCK